MCLLVLFKIIVLGCLFCLFSGVAADLLCSWFGFGFRCLWCFLMWLACNCFGKIRFDDRWWVCMVCLYVLLVEVIVG